MIPFYHGRIDAAGEAGEGFVPKPEETTETHIERFARMGFSQTEMISLIACGHTLGGVHASVNPTITTEAYQSFDDSLSAFDNNIAVQHINDTRTGPLGQAYDPEYPQRSSDTRIFSSDGNVTIRAHAADNNQFINACDAVLGKLFNCECACIVRADLSRPVRRVAPGPHCALSRFWYPSHGLAQRRVLGVDCFGPRLRHGRPVVVV